MQGTEKGAPIRMRRRRGRYPKGMGKDNNNGNRKK